MVLRTTQKAKNHGKKFGVARTLLDAKIHSRLLTLQFQFADFFQRIFSRCFRQAIVTVQRGVDILFSKF